MARELRRVPAAWMHPKDEQGNHIPLLGGACAEAQRAWDEERVRWESEEGPDWWPKLADRTDTYAEYEGPRPFAEEYMPSWPAAERTHLQLYEVVTEGKPITPVFATIEEMARWCCEDEDGEAPFSNSENTYEDWLKALRDPWMRELLEREGREAE